MPAELSDARAFFPADNAEAATDAVAPLPPRVLLTGPPRSGKSSLLLQLAYSHAAQGGAALYVCPSRGHVDSHPPVRPRGGAASSAVDEDVLRRIHIK
jgi:ABC-type molybdenum transport system ATPase subunit/photorepair protein PhrA